MNEVKHLLLLRLINFSSIHPILCDIYFLLVIFQLFKVGNENIIRKRKIIEKHLFLLYYLSEFIILTKDNYLD